MRWNTPKPSFQCCLWMFSVQIYYELNVFELVMAWYFPVHYLVPTNPSVNLARRTKKYTKADKVDNPQNVLYCDSQQRALYFVRCTLKLTKLATQKIQSIVIHKCCHLLHTLKRCSFPYFYNFWFITDCQDQVAVCIYLPNVSLVNG